MIYLISLAVFATAAFLVIGVYQVLLSSRHAVLQRLHAVTTEAEGQPGSSAGKAGLKEDLLRLMGLLGRVVPRRSNLQQIQENLNKAQVLMRAEEYVGVTAVTGLGLFLLITLISGSFLVGLLGGILGLKLPGLLVEQKKNKRSELITNQLPEALNIISNGLRAGFSFPQSMSTVSREMEPPLAEEFDRVLRENRVGKPMDESLKDLLKRSDNDDLNLMVTALLIQRQVGGNLAEVLDNISHTIRERVRIKGEIKTLTAEGRISAVILALLPLVVAGVIAVINPTYVGTLLQEPLGLVLIVLAVLLQVTGVFIIRKIVDVQV